MFSTRSVHFTKRKILLQQIRCKRDTSIFKIMVKLVGKRILLVSIKMFEFAKLSREELPLLNRFRNSPFFESRNFEF